MKQEAKIMETPELLTIMEVMDKLKISRQTLWRLTKEKGVKTLKVGNSIRYRADSINSLIETAA